MAVYSQMKKYRYAAKYAGLLLLLVFLIAIASQTENVLFTFYLKLTRDK